MKIAILLVIATFLAIISITSADSHHTHSHVNHETGKSHGEFVGHQAGRSGTVKDDTKSHKHHSKKPAASKHHHTQEHGKKEVKEIVDHKLTDNEEIGNKHKYESVKNHQSYKNSDAHSTNGATSKAADKQKVAHLNKGFKEEHHKNEHKSRKSFYSNNQKSGEFKLYGNKNKRYHVHHDDKDENGKHAVVHPEHKNGKNTLQRKLAKRSKPVKKNFKKVSPKKL